MIDSVEIADSKGTRQLKSDSFPLALGGAGAQIEIGDVAAGKTAAWIGQTDDELFVQVAQSGEPVHCNGSPVTVSQWLQDGDVIRIASTRVTFRRGAPPRLEVEQVAGEDVTEPPLIAGRASRETAATGMTVRPVEFTPSRVEPAAERQRRIRPVTVLIAVLILALAGFAALIFSVKSVKIVVEPAPDRLVFEGSSLGWEVSGRHLLRPGSYVLVAEKTGYRRLEEPLEITRASGQTYSFALVRLPGTLTIDAGSVSGATVFVNGEEVGATPIEPLELEPGEHVVRVESDRHDPFESVVTIEGGGSEQSLTVTLVPRYAAIGFRSTPAGARVSVDGRSIGTTPLTQDLLAGSHDYEMNLPGHQSHRGSVVVVANQPQELPSVQLRLSDAKLLLRSEPSEASVTVGEDYRGRTPLELPLAPGRTHEIRLTRPSHDAASQQVRLEPGETRELTIVLSPRQGEVEVRVAPGDAEVFVNGESQGQGSRVLTLTALPQQIEVRREGFESYSVHVTPRPGFPQTVDATLKTTEQRKAEGMKPFVRSPQGHKMVLVRGGLFTTGAPRREPGRRANEVRREVKLVRAYYISTTEVTNEQFHEFMNSHRSGRVDQHNLEIGHHPVVRVTWADAARFCNWLSKKEGLTPVYLETGGDVLATDPLGKGYRLPTEAEWVRAARYPDGSTELKYPWGQSLPVPENAGNYADLSAGDLVSPTLDDYNDQFPATAPAHSFRPNALGLFNMGGNVAEWVHDYYSATAPGGGKVETDPVGPKSGSTHVIRGSSWMDASVSELRLSYRENGTRPRADVGFRIARYAE